MWKVIVGQDNVEFPQGESWQRYIGEEWQAEFCGYEVDGRRCFRAIRPLRGREDVARSQMATRGYAARRLVGGLVGIYKAAEVYVDGRFYYGPLPEGELPVEVRQALDGADYVIVADGRIVRLVQEAWYIAGTYEPKSEIWARVDGAEYDVTVDVRRGPRWYRWRLDGLYRTEAEAWEGVRREQRRRAWHAGYLPYGSYIYGQSRDRDYMEVSIQGEEGEWLEDFPRPNGDVDILVPGGFNRAMWRLALECVVREYPQYADVLRTFVIDYDRYRLESAVADNVKGRCDMFRLVPSVFLGRKAVFATLQQRALEGGVFVDNKEAALEFARDDEREVFRRLLFHEATLEDVKVVYRLLFGEEAVTDGMYYAYLGDNREAYRLPDGRIFWYRWGSDTPFIQVDEIKEANWELLKDVEVEGALNRIVYGYGDGSLEWFSE